MSVISSKNNPKLKLINRPDKIDCFVVTDLTSVKKVNQLNLLHSVFLSSPISFPAPTYLVKKDILKNDVVGLVHYLKSKKIKSNKIIYLDEITDPINLAKIILLMKQYGCIDLIFS